MSALAGWQSLLSGAGVTAGAGGFGFCGWVLRKLASHDQALALLVQQVNPPGQKSLRDILQEIQVAQARQEGANSATQNAQTGTHP